MPAIVNPDSLNAARRATWDLFFPSENASNSRLIARTRTPINLENIRKGDIANFVDSRQLFPGNNKDAITDRIYAVANKVLTVKKLDRFASLCRMGSDYAIECFVNDPDFESLCVLAYLTLRI